MKSWLRARVRILLPISLFFALKHCSQQSFISLKGWNCNSPAAEGKEQDIPAPPRCRKRVISLYLPACIFLAPGDPKLIASSLEE